MAGIAYHGYRYRLSLVAPKPAGALKPYSRKLDLEFLCTVRFGVMHGFLCRLPIACNLSLAPCPGLVANLLAADSYGSRYAVATALCQQFAMAEQVTPAVQQTLVYAIVALTAL